MRAEVQKVVDEVNSDVGPRRADQEVQDPARGPAQETGRAHAHAQGQAQRGQREVRRARSSSSTASRQGSWPWAYSQGWPATTRPTPAACSSGAGPARAPLRYRDAAGHRRRAAPARRRLARARDPAVVETLLCLTPLGPAAVALALGRLAGQDCDRTRVELGDHRRVRRDARHAVHHARARQAARPRLEARAPRGRPRAEARARSSASSWSAPASPASRSRSGSWSSPGPGSQHRALEALMGLLDYYRQFEDMSTRRRSTSACASGARASGRWRSSTSRRSTCRAPSGRTSRTRRS